MQVGNEINTTEVAKWLIRSQFDRNLVTLYDVQVIHYKTTYTKETKYSTRQTGTEFQSGIAIVLACQIVCLMRTWE